MEYPKPILHHAPHTRSSMSLCMLEELGIDYDLHIINLNDGDQTQENFSALNPMKKVPVLQHGGVTVSETGAILSYLADAYPQSKLSPAPGATMERATYLRWLFFGGSCFEPAVMDQFFPRKEPLNPGQAAWGDFTRVLDTLREGLTGKEYLLGENFSAADILIGNQVVFAIKYESIDPKQEPAIAAYAARCESRPAWKRAREKDEKHPYPSTKK